MNKYILLKEINKLLASTNISKNYNVEYSFIRENNFNIHADIIRFKNNYNNMLELTQNFTDENFPINISQNNKDEFKFSNIELNDVNKLIINYIGNEKFDLENYLINNL